MTAANRLVLRAMTLVGVIPTLVGLFMLTRYLLTRVPPSTLPEHSVFAFTFLSAAVGGWLLRTAKPEDEAHAG